MSRKNAKPPVIFIHGAFAGPWCWDGFSERFGLAGYKTSAPALRHHGPVPPPASLGNVGLADYIADLEAAVAALDTPPILVGHSLGGLLAQLVAARRKTSALVLLAPSAPWGIAPTTLFEIAAAQMLLLNVGFWNSILPPSPEIAGAHTLDRFPPDEREKMIKRLVPELGRATFQVMHWGLDMSRASEVEPRKINCPLLFLTGADDRINPPGTVARAAALHKNRARIETLPGMSHWLVGEPGWEKVADRCLSWLESI